MFEWNVGTPKTNRILAPSGDVNKDFEQKFTMASFNHCL